ncbi:hypothetical protein GCM10010301_26400 [Streptomyces plicatus]|nr:hypothetical protein GCM10010301_26400 [Streptomyces plicatus]
MLPSAAHVIQIMVGKGTTARGTPLSMPRELLLRIPGDGGPALRDPSGDPRPDTVLNTFKGQLNHQKGQPAHFRRPTGPNSL